MLPFLHTYVPPRVTSITVVPPLCVGCPVPCAAPASSADNSPSSAPSPARRCPERPPPATPPHGPSCRSPAPPPPHPLHLPSLECADRLSLFQDCGVSRLVGQFGALMSYGCFRSDHNTFPQTKVFVDAPQVQTSYQKSGSYLVCLHSVGKKRILRTKLPRNLPPQAPRR